MLAPGAGLGVAPAVTVASSPPQPKNRGADPLASATETRRWGFPPRIITALSAVAGWARRLLGSAVNESAYHLQVVTDVPPEQSVSSLGHGGLPTPELPPAA